MDEDSSFELVPTLFIGMILFGLFICLLVHCAAGNQVCSWKSAGRIPQSLHSPHFATQARCDGSGDLLPKPKQS